MMKPSDLGLPKKYTKWRENQEEAIFRAANSTKPVVLTVCPTGFGKSLAYVAASLLRGGRTMVLTMTKGLQHQLLSDFELSQGMVEVKGANAYPCKMFPDFTCDKGPCIIGQFCAFKADRSCERLRAIDRARHAKLVVSNYSFWLYNHAFSKESIGEFDTLILDEAHGSPQAMANFLSIELDRTSAYLLPYLPSVPEKYDLNDWVKWAYRVSGELAGEEKLAKMDGNADAVSKIRRLQNMFKILVNIDNTWVIDVHPDFVHFAPKWVNLYTEEFLFLDVPKIIMSSASVNEKTASLMGLRNSQCEYLEYPHSFPPESRMLTYIPTVKVRYKMTFEEKLQWIARMDEIIETRLDRKGIIHTISYGRASEIIHLSKYADMMIIHSAKDARSTIRRFKSSSRPQILVSPSVSTGWDFPGTECEYQIISKVPYPSISSSLMKARINEDPEYLQYLAKQDIVQMCGRGTRFKEDYCENFIVDDLFPNFNKRYKKFTPAYFQEAIRQRLVVPKPPKARLQP
jgi:Rad3-related DNA helicase